MVAALILSVALFKDIGIQLTSDPKLSKTLSLSLVMRPLKEAMVALQNGAQEPISLAPELAEHKVNLIFRDRKLSDVMAAIAECLWLDWSRTKGGGYRLSASAELKSQIAKQLSFEKNEAIQIFRSRVARLSDYDLHTSDFNPQLGKALHTLAIHGDALFQGRKEAEDIVDDLSIPYWVPISDCLNANLDAAVNAIFEDGQLRASTDGREGSLHLDPTIFAPWAKVNGKTQPFAACSTRLIWDQFTKQILCNLVWESSDPGLGFARPSFPLSLEPPRGAKLGPMAERLLSWSQAKDPTLLSKSLVTDGLSLGISPYRSGMSSLGDQLRYLAAAADISVVSDAYRVAVSYQQPYNAPTVGDYLNQMTRERVNNIALVKPGGYRSDNGWLMLRHAAFWHLDESEIPEAVLDSLEMPLRKKKGLAIDDYAHLAIQLTSGQRYAFGSDRIGLFEFSRRPFRDDLDLLRLWSEISPDQQQDANGPGLDVSSLSADARSHYRQPFKSGPGSNFSHLALLRLSDELENAFLQAKFTVNPRSTIITSILKALQILVGRKNLPITLSI